MAIPQSIEALRANHLETLLALTTTRTSTYELTIAALANTLLGTENPEHNYEALQNFLKQQKPISIEEYCYQQNDCYIFFLTEIARILTLTKGVIPFTKRY